MALEVGKLSAGDASKLAGKLQWASQHMFRRFGRGMLRPIFDQCKSRRGALSETLRDALRWWRRVLAEGICECHVWNPPDGQVVHLFCDAAGDPPRIAAVLFVDGKTFYTDCPAPAEIVDGWAIRADQQIMGLELLSIALGVSVFAKELEKRKVVIHSDNRGAECGTRKGASRALDHSWLIHQLWAHFLQLKMAVLIKRVPTDDNIADLPSRCSYNLLRAVQAEHRMPHLADIYFQPATWAAFAQGVLGHA